MQVDYIFNLLRNTLLFMGFIEILEAGRRDFLDATRDIPGNRPPPSLRPIAGPSWNALSTWPPSRIVT